MKITIIHGQNHKGSTYTVARELAEKLGGEITEFFLPRDFAQPCLGCTTCFRTDLTHCPHFEKLQPLAVALLFADVILASFYNGKMVFSGSCEFSDNGTVATISPDKIYTNEMFIDPEHTVVMTKTSIPDDNIIPFDTVLSDMDFVPDTYTNYTSNRAGCKFSCELANLWIDGSTMIGEWNTNGSVVPVRMYLHEKVPYVEIYDISGSSEKLILQSYATVVDEASIELVAPVGTVFYTTPASPVIVTKTN